MQFGINVICCELIDNRLYGDTVYLFAPEHTDQCDRWMLAADEC